MHRSDRATDGTLGGDAALTPTTATENPQLPQDETVSAFGDIAQKKRAVAAEDVGARESGDTTSEGAYLRRDAQITDELREERAKQAGVNNAVHD